MPLSIRQNPMQLSQFQAFCSIRGRIHGTCKDVYALEWLGLPEPRDVLTQTLRHAQARAQADGHVFLCLSSLNTRPSPQQSAQLAAQTELLLSGQPFTLPELSDPLLSALPCTALTVALDTYRAQHPQASASMVRNCAVKLLCALTHCLPTLFPTGSASDSPKCVWLGEPDPTAVLFLSLLPKLGCDVALLRPTGTQPLLPGANVLTGTPDPTFEPDTVLRTLSEPAQQPVKQPASTAGAACAAPQPDKKPVLSIPPHPKRTAPRPASTPAPAPARPAPATAVSRPQPASVSNRNTVPLDYETLAGFAPSVVMIEVLGPNGQPCSSGSGVIIAPGGIILTNFHVVSNGAAYAVHLENREAVYQTNELLKYHRDYDLALLRLPGCQGTPIPLYDGPPLARGQQVFAIGSPLGLFNSVSDGIIAGFRTLGQTDMIQFTAPTSPGSSGGALLDRYGNLIGIVTAGFTDGQNLNLAVSYGVIRQFTHGFLPS